MIGWIWINLCLFSLHLDTQFCYDVLLFLLFVLDPNISALFFSWCQKSAAKPLQAPQGYSSAPYLGSGAPSSMYMGVPPYGSSLFNGASIPPYDVPFTGGSAYHYNYGNRLSSGSPYRPFHISGPPPYSGGSMMGNGMLFCFCVLLFKNKNVIRL